MLRSPIMSVAVRAQFSKHCHCYFGGEGTGLGSCLDLHRLEEWCDEMHV